MRGAGGRRRVSLRPAIRDATLATALLVAAIGVGSGGFVHLDRALFGYLAATLVAAFGATHRASAFWRRPASAVYGRALLEALRAPRRLRRALGAAGDDLVAQRFVARRSGLRWAAHWLLSMGTLASFAITLPLVWGWLRFEAAGETRYAVLVAGLPVGELAIDGVGAWLVFHGLALAGVAVTLGALYFLALRLRVRATGPFHLAPLLLLLAVALTGLALPATHGSPALFRLAAAAHELTVVALLVALPASKLAHVLVRPLQLGARVAQAPDAPRVACTRCGEALAPAAQLAGVETLLATHGFAFAGHQHVCPACRRRLLAATQATLVGADFQPRVVGARPAAAEEPSRAADEEAA
jgi:hypothetical protein